MEFNKNNKSLIIAEISANHGQNFNRAISLIKKAKECGADAVKFQTYTPDTITIKADTKYFRLRHSKWRGKTLYQLYERTYTPWSWFKKLKKVADDLGIIFFSTAFDKTAVDFLEELKVPMHKIASFELVDLPLIEYMAKTHKPIILSTGMAKISEIKEGIAAAKKSGAKDIILLKCVSSYPAKPEQMNLRAIPHMKELFHCPVGLSDHTLGTAVPVAAVCLGAVIIEKHFTLSRKIKTADYFFSVEPEEFRELVKNIRIIEKAMGEAIPELTNEEKQNRLLRRSLFAIKDIKPGEILTEENIKSIRPGYGLHPKYLTKLLGKTAKVNLKKGIPLSWQVLSWAGR